MAVMIIYSCGKDDVSYHINRANHWPKAKMVLISPTVGKMVHSLQNCRSLVQCKDDNDFYMICRADDWSRAKMITISPTVGKMVVCISLL